MVLQMVLIAVTIYLPTVAHLYLTSLSFSDNVGTQKTYGEMAANNILIFTFWTTLFYLK